MAPSATKSSFPSFKSSFGDYTLPTSVPKSGNKVPLPEGFPQEIKSSLVWHGLDLDEEEYLRVLTPDDIIEIKNAVKRFCELNIPNYQITPGTFRLPTLGPKILEWKKSLYTGRGLLIIRGIDPSQFTGPENVIVTAGIGCYIGQKRGLQYANGPVLTHVIDLTKDDRFSKEVYIGSPNQNKAMAFHNDEGHILSLYVVHAAQNGGNQKFASSWQVYNALAQQNPEIIKTLCEDWVWDTMKPSPPSFEQPLLFLKDNRIFIHFQTRRFLSDKTHQRKPTLPLISSEQELALHALENLAEKHSILLKPQNGDMQYINNLVLFHRRQAFDHYELNGCRRHYLRMSLRDDENAWSLPAPLQYRCKEIFDTHVLENEEFPWESSPLPYAASHAGGPLAHEDN